MFQGLLRVPITVLRSVCCQMRRELTTSQSGVDKTLLSKLRKKTGFPFINCKKALDQFNNDFEQAEKWLKEQAQKEGWTKASKLQNRPMSQGLIGVVGDQQVATMVEVNCETDFVARNAKFVTLVSNLTLALQEHFMKQADRKRIVGTMDPPVSLWDCGKQRDGFIKASLEGGAVGSVMAADGQTLADLVAMEVGNIGENMALRRAVHLRAGDDNFLSSYVHLSGPDVHTNSECQVGRFGALLELQKLPESDSALKSSKSSSSDDEDEEQEEPLTLEQVCRQVGQHVVGMNPKRIGESGEKPKKNKDEEDSLILQEFLLDPNVSVKDILEKNHIAVKNFVRFECGEDFGEDSS